jgi:hypothetical protein
MLVASGQSLPLEGVHTQLAVPHVAQVTLLIILNICESAVLTALLLLLQSPLSLRNSSTWSIAVSCTAT